MPQSAKQNGAVPSLTLRVKNDCITAISTAGKIVRKRFAILRSSVVQNVGILLIGGQSFESH